MSRSAQASVVTLTMNPSVDITTSTKQIVPADKLRCDLPRRDPGGGGINVARVARTLGGECTAVYPAGGATGNELQALLDRSDIHQHVITIRGATRQSFTVDELESGRQFRFVLPGPALSWDEVERCLDQLEAIEPPPGFVVASGSLPPGVPDDFYARIARHTREVGSKFVLDTSGVALGHAGQEGVYLLKPNLRELRALVGEPLLHEDEQEAAAQRLIKEGRAKVVILSLGSDGALLVSRDVTERLAALQVPQRSAVGAGDSMLGAVVLALARRFELVDAVRFGMAAGAAALMTPGTELCRREDVERLYAEMRNAVD